MLVWTIGESIDQIRLELERLLSIPSLLVCTAIGILLSVSVSGAVVAELAAIGIVFVLFLGESVVGGGLRASGFNPRVRRTTTNRHRSSSMGRTRPSKQVLLEMFLISLLAS